MWITTKFYQTIYKHTTYNHIFLILILYSIRLIWIEAIIESTQLNDKSYTDLNWEYDIRRSKLWSPKTPLNVWPDFKLIQECDTDDFKLSNTNFNQLMIMNTTTYNTTYNNNNNQELFEWTSISIFTIERLKRGYILLGGSYKTKPFNLSSSTNSSSIVSPRHNSQMILCYLDWKSNYETLLGFGFNYNACIILQSNSMNRDYNDHEFLGATSQSIKINQDLSLFLYCDPLWRANSIVPVGRCFLHYIHDGVIQSYIELADFCQTGLKVTTPCAAGHSIALTYNNDNDNNHGKGSRSINEHLSNVRLWIGQPLSTPYGRIQILTNLYSDSMKVTTINRPETTTIESMAIGSLFGYALTDGFVTAPGLLTREQYNYTYINHLVGINVAKSYRDKFNGFYGNIDWFPEINSTDPFNGNGMSVLRVHLKGSYIKSVIMGAPYAGNTDIKNNNDTKMDPIQSTGYNIGRIYLFCQSDQRINIKSDSYKPSTTIIDYLDGPKNSRNFGFALTNLGDYDGDGNDDVAVGSPDLENTIGYSYIYLIRILSNCKFDRTPLHILRSPKNSPDFGAHLPSYTDDLDFNGINDLVVPMSPIKQNGISDQPIIVYASRYKWIADCHYIFPPWLAIRNLLKNDLIPIQIIIYFKDPKNKQSRSDQTDLKLLNSLQIDNYIHQINPDWNATDTNGQRFQLMNSIQSRLELKQNQLIIDFNIQAKINIEDMNDLESITGGVFIGYRFLQPCYGNQNVIDQNGTCLDGGWLKRPFIDWSKCLAKIPLSRYVCYPTPVCKSDVVLRVKDIQSNKVMAFQYIHDKQKSISILNQSDIIQYPLTTTVDLEYGNRNSSRPQLQIEIYNYGPTKAQGIRMELQFHGNLKFSRLELEVDSSNTDSTSRHSEVLMVEVSENETWVHCPIGTLLPPIILSNSDKEIIEPNQRFILSTYYDKFMLDDDQVDFQLGAGVTINVITGTPDPQPISNSIRFNYQVIHRPNIRISYGPGEIPSRMDNRSVPSKSMLSQQKRVIVSEIGPKVEHILQIEYMGPSNKLKNVTMNVLVPIELDSMDKIGNAPQYVLYMFNEIRAPSYNDNNVLEWIDSRPKVFAMGRHQNDGSNFRNDDGDDMSKVGSCIIVNSEKVVNPRELIPMDVNTVYSRKRRGVLTKTHENKINIEKSFMNNDNESFTEDSIETIQSSSSSSSSSPKIPVIQFRRLQKEVFECNRVGNRIQKPPICAEIICHVDELVKNRPVLIKVTGWLWARTLFAKHISDVDLVTIISVNQGSIPKGVQPANEPIGHFYLSQTFFFPQIRPKLIHQLPIWPIIVGIILGVLFLYLLIILLYLLGFFRRRKTELRKAMLSKGGAEDTYKHEQTELLLNDQNKSKQSVTKENNNYHPPDGYTTNVTSSNKNKKLKKKHKRELNILHPGDLSPSGTLINTCQDQDQDHQDQDHRDQDHHHDEQQNKDGSEKQNLITDSTSSQ
uniref:Integrin n=1 Tax=Schistosoma mansoni TaxID=6183 RepID=A0A0E3T038_SCHMA|nr:integrin [Schistosoma mansoni]